MAHWEQVTQTGTFAEQVEFMESLIKQRGRYTDDYIARFRTVINEDIDNELSEWMGWQEALGKYDALSLQEMIEAGTMLARRNPKLPKNSKVQHPYNQLVKHVRNVAHNRRTVRDAEELREGEEINAQTHEAFLKKMAAPKQQRRQPDDQSEAPGSSNSNLGTPSSDGQSKKKELDETTKVAAQNLRKWHGAYDRAKRAHNATMTKCEHHKSTQNSQLLVDLNNFLGQGTKYDDDIVALESKTLNMENLSDEEVGKAVSPCTAMQGLIKDQLVPLLTLLLFFHYFY